MWEIPIRFQEKIAYHEDGQTLEQAARRGCGMPFCGGAQDLTGHGTK